MPMFTYFLVDDFLRARSIDALTAGNSLSAVATTSRPSSDRQRTSSGFASFAYFFRRSSMSVDVGQLVLRDVRNGSSTPGAQMLSGLSPYGAHDWRIDTAPPAEVWQRLRPAMLLPAWVTPRRLVWCALSRPRARCGRPVRSLNSVDLDAELAGQAPDGGRRRRRRTVRAAPLTSTPCSLRAALARPPRRQRERSHGLDSCGGSRLPRRPGRCRRAPVVSSTRSVPALLALA